ncbi:amidohydrolase family protein [Granulicella aggregans]|jgi:L-fuconolactonase|uniref:amidohydrolase family protein n=1 Tax=Granulicella aggregans TaxID=474949 RepID=UPI0021E05E55|nr:amidohydrolase family protein [Granulicella aggregans]
MVEIIDSHHHLWRYTTEDYGWIGPQMQVLKRDFLPEDLSREMAAAQVHGSVAVQARQTIEETRWLLDLAAQNPALRGVVGWLPIVHGDLPLQLSDLGDIANLKGLRHVIQDEPDENFILRDDFNVGIASLLGTGLVYDILIHERHLPQAAIFVSQHPKQAFVLDHLAKPKIAAAEIEPWRSNLFALAAHPNVFCKLSGLVTEADWERWTLADLRPYLDAAIVAFGPERLMAGSDWPVCLLASGYTRWWETLRGWMKDFDVQHQEAILGQTAQRVYRL